MAATNSAMSGPRWLTLVVSLIGLVLFIRMYVTLQGDEAQSVGPGYLILGLPFVLGAIISVLPMRKRTRIMLFWLTTLIVGFAGALTLFSGIGVYNVFVTVVFLIAAWFENESAEPSMLHRKGDITTNARTRPRA